MLPAAARLTRSEDFRTVTRRGRRVGRPRIVVHALVGVGTGFSGPVPTLTPVGPDTGPDVVRTISGARVGFVVSKSVGNSVVRHRVLRRLRHVARDRLGTLPPGSSLVVRALPSAAEASSAEFRYDFDAALRRLRLTADQDGGAE